LVGDNKKETINFFIVPFSWFDYF